MRKPWLEVAEKEVGVKEIAGRKHNTRILEYHKHGAPDLSAQTDEVPWCASFVGWVLSEVGIKGTGKANARSYLKWGSPCDLKVGAVVVFWRGKKNGWTGHVGFVSGKTANAYRIKTLGGNQNNQVSVKPYNASRVLGFRWHPMFDELIKKKKVSPKTEREIRMENFIKKLLREKYNRLPMSQRTKTAEQYIQEQLEEMQG